MSESSHAFRTLPDIVREHSLRSPGSPALQFERRTMTWAEWDHRSSQLANTLIAEGLQPGGRVGYLGKNSDQFFQVFFGTAKAAMVTVPLNWRLAVPEIAFILGDAQCEILFVGADYAGLVDALREACPRIRRVVGVDGEAAGAARAVLGRASAAGGMTKETTA